jgi:DNA-binding NarL/FixJ family response regulator
LGSDEFHTTELLGEALMKVLIADEQPMLLEGIRHMLELDDRFEVAGTVRSGSAVLPAVIRTRPEVALLDIGLPGLDGYECLLLLQERHPEIKVVLLAQTPEAIDVSRAFRLGACGVIVKDIVTTDFARAVYEAVTGGTFQSVSGPQRSQKVAAAEAVGLTTREVEIVRAVAQGLSNREIAHSLRIAEPTVKFHLSNVYRRLRVTNRTEAARWALSTGVASEHLRSGATAVA